MTKRILLALLALIITVLVAAVIPLGFNAAGHDRHSYVEDARAAARAAAAVTEEQLADHHPSPDMGRVLAAAERVGDTLVIMDAGGQVIASAGQSRNVPRDLARKAVGSGRLKSDVANGYVRVVVPVRDSPNVVGTVSLARPLGPLGNRIRALWFTLALIAFGAIAASAVLAFALARWVSRPLAELDASARRVGAGDLAARTPPDVGPPELRRLAVSFNAMAARLESLVHQQRAMVADVSHQLRTPLAALRLRLDLLAQDADPATGAELAGALEEFTRLSRLIDGLLAVARAESTVPQPVVADVGEMIRERVAAWQPVADDRRVWLAADVAGPVTAALGEGHLEQILDNLIANALDATSAEDHITVSAELLPDAASSGVTADPERSGGVRIVVADDGPGMSPTNRAHAFGRFTTASPGGTGLGLAIVKRLVVSNGGTATLDETPGGGLRVLLEFPRTSAYPTAAGGTAFAAEPLP